MCARGKGSSECIINFGRWLVPDNGAGIASGRVFFRIAIMIITRPGGPGLSDTGRVIGPSTPRTVLDRASEIAARSGLLCGAPFGPAAGRSIDNPKLDSEEDDCGEGLGDDNSGEVHSAKTSQKLTA
jgi:hypothetical protein